MNILYCLDQNYAPFLPVALSFVMQHHKANDEVNVFIIHPDITDATQQQVRSAVAKYAQLKLTFIKIGADLLDNLPVKLKNLSQVANARLYISKLYDWQAAGVERLLYLDFDTVVLDDLRSLYDQDLHGKALGGVVDTGMYIERKEYLAQVGLDTHSYSYINSGVLLIDIAKWNEKNVPELAAQWFAKYSQFSNMVDQDIINYVFQGDIQYLNPRYNFTKILGKRIAKYTRGSISELMTCENVDFPVVVFHSTGSFKPWHKGDCTWKSALYQQRMAEYHLEPADWPKYLTWHFKLVKHVRLFFKSLFSKKHK